MVRYWLRQWFQSGFTLIGWLAIATPIPAQIVPDNTLPTNSIVPLSCTNCTIDGGTIRGTNLFHSFAQFSVPTGGTAAFNNPAQIQNILTRVTGNLGSNIDGLIQANGTANLFLMNPNGIIFGSNASLNVGGSFVATTANAIQFGDQGFFSASNPTAPPLLTINPSAFLFNQLNQGRIVNQSTTPLGATPGGFDLYGLQVPIGQSIALMGGDVRLEGGGINAPGGQVELGGIVAPGSIGLDFQTDGLHLQFPSAVPRADISLTNGALVSVASAGGGAVTINVRNLDIAGDSVIRGGIETGAIATRPAGAIVVNAVEGVRLDGADINSNVRSGSVGDAGAIVINTGALSLTNQAVIRSVIAGQGNSGAIVINARESALLDASSIETGAFAGGNGNGAIVQITTGSLTLLNGAYFDTSSVGQGDGGTIMIQATGGVNLSGNQNARSIFLSRIGQNGVGKGGDILIAAESFSLKDGRLDASVSGTDANGKGTPGRGDAGNITLNIRGVVEIDGTDDFLSGITSFVGLTAEGNAGVVTLNAEALSINKGVINSGSSGRGNAGNITIQVVDGITLSNGSQIGNGVTTPPSLATAVGNSGELRIRARILTAADSSITSQITGQGNAGNLFITVDRLQLSRASIITSASNGGNAGNIQIDARDAVTLQGTPANIQSVLYSRVGKAGNITINTGSLSLVDAVGISSFTDGQGSAGDITLNVRDRLLVDNSFIFSAAFTKAQDNGGDIRINTSSLFLLNGGQLNAETYGQGNAGSIMIDARDLISLAGSKPSSIAVNSGSNGLTGNITITSPSLTISDQSAISANANSVNGGNITLNLGDLLLLRRGGTISTNAGTAQAGGNGGNITINAPQGFIVGVRSENSDISANAFSGSGGRVNITAQGIYGLQFQPRLTPFSDITASSTLGVSGVVTLNTLGLDPSRGLVSLPTGLVDPSNQIDQRCVPKGTQQASSFIITGRGGVASSPTEPLMQQGALMELVKLPEGELKQQAGSGLGADTVGRSSASSVPPSAANEMIEANGWIADGKGNVQLVAAASTEQPYSPAMLALACAQR